MEILTIYNYSWYDRHFTLLYMWLHQVSLLNDLGLKVKVLSMHSEPMNIKRLHGRYLFDWVRLEARHRVGIKLLDHHNVRFKMWNLCSWKVPYIFIDVDAIPFCPISHLVKAADDKGFIAVDHQDIPKHTEGRSPFMNGGVQIVSRPGMFTYDDYTRYNTDLACPGAEQALMFTHFRRTGYDYRHAEVGYTWNACAGYSRTINLDGRWACRAVRTCLVNDRFHSLSIPEGEPICINHYWDEFKPWKIDCPMYVAFREEAMREEPFLEKFRRKWHKETF